LHLSDGFGHPVDLAVTDHFLEVADGIDGRYFLDGPLIVFELEPVALLLDLEPRNALLLLDLLGLLPRLDLLSLDDVPPVDPLPLLVLLLVVVLEGESLLEG
jgi:hypothetical protein